MLRTGVWESSFHFSLMAKLMHRFPEIKSLTLEGINKK